MRAIRRKFPRASVFIDWDFAVACLLGAGAGYWAIRSHAIESTESTDLYTLATAAVGLLAIALATLALLTGFLSGKTARDLRDRKGNIRGFFRPFVFVTIISGLSLLASVAGAIDSSATNLSTNQTDKLQAVLFGVSIWFFVWATIGVMLLVRTVLTYGEVRAEAEADMYEESEEERTAGP
jgi:hypothetical protein